MNDFQAKRSMPLIYTILGTLMLSVILLFALPTLTAGDSCDPDWDDCSSLNFSDATAYIQIFSSSGWIIDLARIGAIGIVVATLAFRIDQRNNQKFAILAGAIAMLIMPIWIFQHRDGGGIGLGIVLYCVGVIAVAIIPFILPTSNPTPSISTPYRDKEDFRSNRSVPLMLIVVGILAISIIALYTLPTLNPSSGCDGYSGDCDSVTFSDASEIIRYGYQDGWVIDLARLGAISIVAATIGLTFDQRRLQVIAIAAGAAAMFVLPVWIFGHREGDSLGFGLVLYTLGTIATAYIGILYPTPGVFFGR